jgi:hypothetical protein
MPLQRMRVAIGVQNRHYLALRTRYSLQPKEKQKENARLVN